MLAQESDSLAQERKVREHPRDTTLTAEGEKGALRWLKENTGFFFDLNAGYNYRFNTFVTARPLLDESPVGYSSLNLGVYDLSLQLGLAGISFLEADYESPYPRTAFQENALEARKDRAQGLEKYTAGVNLLPIWRLLLPDSVPDIIEWLPALEIRYTRELTQNTAVAERESLILNSLNNLGGDLGLQDFEFQRVDPGKSFSFKTRYQYASVTIPVYVWNWNDMESHTALRIGVSRWNYSRVYSTRFPKFHTPIVYEADAAGEGLLLSFRSRPRDGFRINIAAGVGRGELQFDDRELAGALPFFYETDDFSDTPFSLYGEGSFSYRFSFFSESAVTMHLEPGLDINAFNVSFDSFGEVVSSGSGEGEALSSEEASPIQHFDIVYLPWVRFSFSI